MRPACPLGDAAPSVWTRSRALTLDHGRTVWRRADGFLVVDDTPVKRGSARGFHDQKRGYRASVRDRWRILTPQGRPVLGGVFGVSEKQAMAFCDRLRPLDPVGVGVRAAA